MKRAEHSGLPSLWFDDRPWPRIIDTDVHIGRYGTMPIPTSQRIIFRKNPLHDVICQLRFPTILAISSETPSSFQEQIRRTYPIYERVDESEALSPMLRQIPFQFPGVSIIHKFSTEDSRRSISINQDFIALTEKDYSRWEAFETELSAAESVLRAVYQPAFYSRVGLRYQNVIDRGQIGLDDRNWNSLISPYFSGPMSSSDVQNEVQEFGSEALIRLDRVEGGHVLVRCGLARTQRDPKPRYLIDADFFVEGRYTHERTFGVLDIFHQIAGDLFRWAIAPDLQEALDPAPSG